MSRRLGPLSVAGILLTCLAFTPGLRSAPRTDHLGDALPPAAKARIGSARLFAGGNVVALAYGPEGKVLYSLSDAGLLLAWDTSTGKEARPLESVPEGVAALAVAPTGRLLAAATREGGVHVWDLPAGRLLRTHKLAEKPRPVDREGPGGAAILLPPGRGRPARPVPAPGGGIFLEPPDGPASEALALAFTSDNKSLAVGRPGGVHLLDLAGGKVVRTLKGPSGGLGCLTFSGDDKLLAGAGADGSVLLWDRASGKRLRRYDLGDESDGPVNPGMEQRPQVPVLRLDFAAGDRKLQVSAGDGTLRSFELDSIEELEKARYLETGEVSCVSVSADRKRIALGGSDGGTRILQSPGGKVLHTVTADEVGITCVALAPGGNGLATGDGGGNIRLWDLGTEKEVAQAGKRGTMRLAVFAADGKSVVSVDAEGVRHHSTETGKLTKSAPVPGSQGIVSLSNDARLLAILQEGGGLKVYDAATGAEKHTLAWEAKEGPVQFDLTPDGKTLVGVAMFQPSLVRLWDMSTGKERPPLGEAEGRAGHLVLSLSADGRVLTTGSARVGQLRRWELSTGMERAPFRLPPELRDLAAERELGARVLRPGNEDGGVPMLQGLTPSPDGRLLAVPHGTQILVCALPGGKVLRRLPGAEDGGVNGLSFSADSKLLAVTASENAVRLYDVETGGVKATLRGHRGAVTQVLFGPRGRDLLSVSADGTALVWDVAEAVKLGTEGGTTASRQAADLWADLGSEDGARAEAALRELQDNPKLALRLFKDSLRAARPASAEEVTRLLGDLDSDDFEVREEATRQLAALGEPATPALRKALARKGPKDRQRRIKELLDRLERPASNGDTVRGVRAIEALERIGGPEARTLLQALAKGEAEALLTREAKEALGRMGGD